MISRKFIVVFTFLVMIALTAVAQNEQQAKLLKKAYKSHSTKMLYKFFDNWSEKVKPNEDEAQNPYVAEAYKVFAAFYQPMQIYHGYQRYAKYDDKPYFIVQSSLRKIEQAEIILYKPEEIDSFLVARILKYRPNDTIEQKKWINICREDSRIRPDYGGVFGFLNWLTTIPTTTLDSSITFRVPVHFDGKKVVYLTKKYSKLLNSFLGDDHVDLGTYDIMQTAFAKDESQSKQEFLHNAVHIYYGHWGGYWQYNTYPEAEKIIFNPEMSRAVVLFRFVYEGGEAILEKQNGEWKVVDFRFTWQE
jgi:hypothetical protein